MALKNRLCFWAGLICFVLLITSGCQPITNLQVEQRYPWASSGGDSSMSAPKTETLSVGFFPAEINGKTLDPTSPTVSYEGTPLKCTYNLQHQGSRPVQLTMLITVNGILQPFRMENDTQSQTSYTIPVEEHFFEKITFFIDDPVNLSADKTSYVTIHILANYDDLLDGEEDNVLYNLSVYQWFLIPPVEPQWIADAEEPQIASLDQIEAKQNVVPKAVNEEYPSCRGIFQENLFFDQEGNPAMPQYLTCDSEKQIYLALWQNKSGRYRTLILQDGKPLAAFAGDYYLDWETSGPEQDWEIPLSSDLLTSGKHNYYAITYDLDALEQGLGEWVHTVDPPYTIVKP